MLHILNLPTPYSETMGQLLQTVDQMVKYLNDTNHDPQNVEQVGIMHSTLGVLHCQVESLAFAEQLVRENSTDPGAEGLLVMAKYSSLELLKRAASLFSSTAQISGSHSH